MKKHIKIKFVDFTPNFDPQKAFIWKRLWQQYDVVLSEQPDWLVFSVFGEKHFDYNDCVKIFETGENQAPDFNLCDYAIGFEHLQFGDRYLRFPQWLNYQNDIANMQKKHLQPSLAGKIQFCSFVYSNSNASHEREEILQALSAYKTVNSGGKYNNNVGGAVIDKLAFQQRHKFAIAFENASHEGYTTEKLVQAFAAQTIPIYWGDPKVAETFNPKSFINCHDFKTWEEIVNRIREIDNNDDLWLQIMKEPALRDPGYVTSSYEELDRFLQHIFDQTPQEAKRYSRDYWTLKQLRIRQREQRAYRRSLFGMSHKLFSTYIYPYARRHGWLWTWTQKLMHLLKM